MGRESIRWGGGLLALVLATTACGGDATSGDGDQPRQGGVLTFATDADPACIDPHQSPTAASQLITRGVVDSLVAQDPETLEIKPWLAESWTVSPDAKRFTFDLRDDVTFSDGERFDAAAVKENFDRIVDPATKSLLAAGFLTGYAGTTVVDPHTVTVAFDQPNAPFLQAASTAFLGMESPATFTSGQQELCQKVIGSGPFVVDDYVRQQKIELARRPDYQWAPPDREHTGAAYLDRVVITVVPENGVRLGSLRTGQVDAMANVPPREADSLTGDLRLLTKEQPGIAYSLVLNARKEPWADVTLRRAFAKSVDTEQIVSTVYQGKYPRATSVLTPATPGYTNVLERGQFDRAAAEELFDQAGWAKGPDGVRAKDGEPLTVEWTYISPAREQRDVLAQLVQQQLREVGVQIRLNPLPIGDVVSKQAKGETELSDISFVRADGDVLRTTLYSPRGGVPASVDPELPGLLSAATATIDPERRAATYERAQRRIVEQSTAVPVYNPTYLLGTSKAVHDITFDPQGLPAFHDAWVAR
ncbi:ABC transporter substrate-binding protein [Amycolatopsis cihanbeyliensis]|uniref:Peptide/nickel transport system substrate-binding protein n=1 Tax=Amycolatopsis cihanbeyliensis TaxID=1128664 RepID=A0A542DIF4_AMYCI|nr:ABC transporter substrate-binding protein [Amycolatopsis cihanbeyliensis]TQJ02775.1 peptide/nickel transport system substrate-binding protein [Amycolatopsis cihanbeyliensis]